MMNFYKEKRILITGHTGFKGSWLCHILKSYGANICGISLNPNTKPSLFELTNIKNRIDSYIIDIRDYKSLLNVFKTFQPEVVFHLAAQPIVRESYNNPRYTYETNVMGTVNVMECIRNTPSVKSVLNVTTDKVYQNKEWCWGYREDEILDGFDPYSNSKSCSELVTHSYINSFFNKIGVAVSTARAGNVIGGGDFAKDRIIPDCVRATIARKSIQVRNPNSIRPYQHVLEPLFAYLLIIQKQWDDNSFSGYYNIGPNEDDCITTGNLVDSFVSFWGKDAFWQYRDRNGPHEANFLKLDCSKIKTVLGWKPKWKVDKAIKETVDWYKAWVNKEDLIQLMNNQIDEYIKGQ